MMRQKDTKVEAPHQYGIRKQISSLECTHLGTACSAIVVVRASIRTSTRAQLFGWRSLQWATQVTRSRTLCCQARTVLARVCKVGGTPLCAVTVSAR